MPHVQLPFFSKNIKYINSKIGVKAQEDTVYYFVGSMSIYKHHKEDYRSFRYISSLMIDLGNVRQVEIKKAFEVSIESVKRWTKVFRKKGAKGFFEKMKIKRKGRVLCDQAIIDAQHMLNALKTPKEIEEELGIKQDTLRKAINDDRLIRPQGILPEPMVRNASIKRKKLFLEEKSLERLNEIVKKNITLKEIEYLRKIDICLIKTAMNYNKIIPESKRCQVRANTGNSTDINKIFSRKTTNVYYRTNSLKKIENKIYL